MKNKLLMILMASIMTISLMACGSTEEQTGGQQSVEASQSGLVESSKVDVTEAPTPEPTATPKPTATPEPTIAPLPDHEYAMTDSREAAEVLCYYEKIEPVTVIAGTEVDQGLTAYYDPNYLYAECEAGNARPVEINNYKRYGYYMQGVKIETGTEFTFDLKTIYLDREYYSYAVEDTSAGTYFRYIVPADLFYTEEEFNKLIECDIVYEEIAPITVYATRDWSIFTAPDLTKENYLASYIYSGGLTANGSYMKGDQFTFTVKATFKGEEYYVIENPNHEYWFLRKMIVKAEDFSTTKPE